MDERAESERGRVRITGLKAMELKNAAGQSLVRVETDAGLVGIGEAGTAGPAARANLLWLEPVLIGADPLNIDKLYHEMMGLQHTYQAHVPTVSGVDIALWDLAGKILDLPVSSMLTGRFRDRVEIYYGGAPADWSDRAAVDDWVSEFRAHPHGYRTLKFDFDQLLDSDRLSRPFRVAEPSQMLKGSHFKLIRDGYETMRDALSWDLDFIVHCHNEWDLPTAIGISQAVEEVRPLWIEDPLQVWFSDGYKQLRQLPACPSAPARRSRDSAISSPSSPRAGSTCCTPTCAGAAASAGAARSPSSPNTSACPWPCTTAAASSTTWPTCTSERW